MGNSQGPRGKVIKEGVVDKHSVEQKMGSGKWNRYNFVLYDDGLIDIKRQLTGGISRTVKVDASSGVKPMIASDKKGRSLFVINKLIYTNKDKQQKRADMFVFAPTDEERDSWMKEIKRVIVKLGGSSKKRESKAALSSHVVRFTAKDAEKFMSMQDSEGNISEDLYKDAHSKIETYMKRASPSRKPAGLEDLGIGAFMFKSLVSRSSRKPKKKRPKRPPRKIKSNNKISTRATNFLKTKGLTDTDRKKIKQQQRGHVMVAKLAAQSRRRIHNQKKTRTGQKSRSAQPGKKIVAATRREINKPPTLPTSRSRSSPAQRPLVVKPTTPKPKVSGMSWKPRKVTKPKPTIKKKVSKPRLKTPTKKKNYKDDQTEQDDDNDAYSRQMAAKERQRKKLEERKKRKLEKKRSELEERNKKLEEEQKRKDLEQQRKNKEKELKRQKRKDEELKREKKKQAELERQQQQEREKRRRQEEKEEKERRQREEEQERQRQKREKKQQQQQEEEERQKQKQREKEQQQKQQEKEQQQKEQEKKKKKSPQKVKVQQQPKKKRLSRKVKKTVAEIEDMLRNKGFNLHRDCSNFDRKTGKTTMEGSVKCGAKFKDNAYVIFLYKKPNAVGGLNMTKEKMRSEIADYKYMRDAGLPLPEIYSDVFDCKVNGTKTFGFLVEVVHTSMADPYKPQAHKMTYKFIKPALDDLDYDQLQRALNDLEMIGEYTKNVHFVHDLQLLCQDSAPDEEENGRIFVIDPGELRKPKKNQMRVLQRKIAKMMTTR